MGVAITELLSGKDIQLKDLKNKVIAIDAFNMLYQFLTTLRGPDGSPLQNSKGQITSHIQGLLSRNLKYLKIGIKPIFVFDGKPPELKKKERERRQNLKKEAQRQYDIAKERNDLEGMRKYSSRIITVNEEIINSAKKLLNLLGIPHVDAPSEGEVQAGELVKQKVADYAVSQDADTIIFGAPNVIRNLSISGKKKIKGKLGTQTLSPTLFELDKTLEDLNINQDQLIILAILVGTDFNIGGIKGLGPKKALKKVREFDMDFESLFEDVKWDETFDFSWKEIVDIYKNIPVLKDVKPIWKEIDQDKLKTWLTKDYEFSEERLNKSFEIISEIESSKKQKGLGDFF